MKKSIKAVIAVILLAAVAAFGFLIYSGGALQRVEPSATLREAVELFEKDSNIYHIENTYEKLLAERKDADAVGNDDELICYNQLDEAERKMYADIYYAATNFDYLVIKAEDEDIENDEISDKFKKRLDRATLAFHYDYPEIFWVGSINSYRVSNNIFFTDFHYCFSDEKNGYAESELAEFNKSKAEFDNRLDKMITEIKADCTDNDWKNALTACRYICDKTTYDSKLADSITSQDVEDEIANDIILNGGVYSVVVNNTGVCRGYAELYRVVMKSLGIPCATIFGNLAGIDNSGKDKSNHEWNIARINGKYCNIDVTNVDTQDEDIDYDFSYFGASDKVLKKTHTRINSFDFPECKDESNSFFRHEGLYSNKLSSSDINKALQYAIDNNYSIARIKYSKPSMAGKAYDKFVENSRVVQNALTELDKKYDDKINIDDIKYYMTYVDDKEGIFYIALIYKK